VKLFCRNTASIRLVRTLPLQHEYENHAALAANLQSSLEEPGNNAVFYLLLRAVDRFHEAHSRFPGWTDEQVAGDIALLKQHVIALLAELSLDSSIVSDDAIHEMCRFGASELHNIAAFLGGVVSQEVIKVLTHQWVPMSNSLLYNGMNSTTTVWTL